jgi:hypothetical protein
MFPPVEPTRRRYKILLTAMERIAWPMRSQRDAAKGQGTDFDEAAARQLANDPDYLKRIAETALEKIIAVDTAAPVVDPIHAAIEAHRAAGSLAWGWGCSMTVIRPMFSPRQTDTASIVDDYLVPLKFMAEFAAGLVEDGLDANGAKEGYFHIRRDEGERLAF